MPAHSAYWAGITQIRDAAGQVVTGAQITSESGVLWGNSIRPGILRGDFDGNSFVDIGDFAILASHFNHTGAPWNGGDR